ncbi:SpoIIE family protein phosphatase [Streptomyces caniscabiei]|uniref:SpoIIE family protein phosphatase n=1 Tax=Streptomyces caniscabiei TaxID=2746961 RepID=UPI0015C5054A|nr:SpoIIE family protein phosphatase [Streptomyces caniscabiei]MDX3731964.1 SpoIIE family protein phosphatase [Streptomyces caniscabiei]
MAEHVDGGASVAPGAVRLRLLEAQGDALPEPEVMRLALQQATAALGALGGLVHLRREGDDELRLVAAAGLPGSVSQVWLRLPDSGDSAPARAMRDAATHWAERAREDLGAAGMIAVPLLGVEGPLGAISLFLVERGEPDAARRSFLEAVAAWAAQRLRRFPVLRAPAGGEPVNNRAADPAEGGGGPPQAPVVPGADRAAVERTARMGDLTSALAEALTAKDVVQAAAEHVLPPLGADGLVIEAIEGRRLRVVGSVGYASDFLDRFLDGISLESNTTVADVLRRRTPVFVESEAEFLRLYPELGHMTPLSGKQAWAFLPLIAAGHPIGTCVIAFSEPRGFGEAERTLLTALSGLVAQALGRARLYDAEHGRAQSLQRGLLPRSLPSLPAVTAAARYLPAGRGAAVGGDWYDVIPLSADRVAMVIGDVMGHGITEAVTMGRLRTAVHTLAGLELAPEEILGKLNDLVADLGDDQFATCLYAVYDPVSRVCTFCRAGHPPPLVLASDGTPRWPDIPANPPLGVAEPPFETGKLRLPEESLLLFYTDGLIRPVGQNIDDEIARLVETAVSAAAENPVFLAEGRDGGHERIDTLCGLITQGLLHDGARTDDDAALLIAHTHRTPAEDVVSWPLPEDARAAAEARAHVRRQLAVWHLGDLEATTEIVVSELVGNAVRHAKGPLRLRLLRSRSLICEVYDGSLATPRIRRVTYMDEGGRGLFLVAALSSRWGARYLEEGKCLWAEQELAPAEPRQL